jgi:hypothetical protein
VAQSPFVVPCLRGGNMASRTPSRKRRDGTANLCSSRKRLRCPPRLAWRNMAFQKPAAAYRAGVNRLRIMRGMYASELAVGVAALAVMASFALWRLLLWIKNSPLHPDPWDDATE